MPRRFIERIPTTRGYSSGAATPLELSPRPYVITSMLLDFDFDVSIGAVPGTTQDALFRTLSSLSLIGDGGRAYVSVGDLRTLHFENKVLLPQGGKYVGQTLPIANAVNALRKAQVRIHFGSRPVSPDGTYNPFDLTAGIPAGQSTLTLIPTWAVAAALGAGWTVNAGTNLGVTLFGVQAKPGEVIRPGALPMLMGANFVPAATGGSLGEGYAIPQSHFWHSSMVLSLAGVAPADNRSSAALSDIGVKLPADGGAQIAKWAWPSFQVDTGRCEAVSDDDGTAFGIPVVGAGVDAGVGRIDMTTIGGNVNQLYGADLRAASPGDVVVNMGVAVVGTVAFLHRLYDLP